MIIPTDAREELRALAYGLSPKRYIDKIWSLRPKVRLVKARSLSWPPTCRTKDGYVLRKDQTNVTPLKRKAGERG